MPRATGTFQQRELREKILRLEQEIARARAAAEAVARQAGRSLRDFQEKAEASSSEGASSASTAGPTSEDERTKG